MAPIVHGTAILPLLRFPRGAALTIRVVMDSEISLTTHTAKFAARSRFGQTRPIFVATEPGDAFSKSGQTITLSLAPEAINEMTDSELTLADLQTESLNAYRIDFLDADEALAVRLQGDLEWLPEEGAWEDEPTSTITLPEITVSIVAGSVTVSVALITGGASVDNETVNAAIEEDAAASRTALGLGTAATTAATAYATAAEGAAATAAKTKTDFLTVTASTDLDTIRTKVAGLDAAIVLIGEWDASSGAFPGSGAAQRGHCWIVSVPGTHGGVAFGSGDRITAIVDNASTSAFSSNWFHEDYTDRVSSVAGKTGAVTIEIADVGDLQSELDALAGGSAPTNLLAGITPTVQTGWTASGGGVYVANIASGFAGLFWEGLTIEDGALYLLRFYCSARTSGTLSTALGTIGSTLANPLNIQVWNSDALSWSGFFHMKHTPSQPGTITIRANNGFIGTIQSVSLTKLAALPT